MLTSRHTSAYINITEWTHVCVCFRIHACDYVCLTSFPLSTCFAARAAFFLFVDLFRRSVNRVLPLPSRSLPLIPEGNVSGAEERSKQIQRQFSFRSFSPLWLHPFFSFLLPSNALITYLPASLFYWLVYSGCYYSTFVLHLVHSLCPFILSHLFPRYPNWALYISNTTLLFFALPCFSSLSHFSPSTLYTFLNAQIYKHTCNFLHISVILNKR